MIKRKLFIISILVILFSTSFFSLTSMSNGIDNEISSSSLKTSSLDYKNATIISDSAIPWNDGVSYDPKIAIDNSGTIHVVWEDYTVGAWGTDVEIMYASSSDGITWSNATVVSDDVTGWNDGSSYDTDIAVDKTRKIHVVWEDNTNGAWGTDTEIMYTSSSDGITWSNATVISDDGTLWNNDGSYNPSITVDKTNEIHIVWLDYTDGAWGTDSEIMYTSSSDGITWSNATVISDSATPWNDQASQDPNIATDNSGTIYVVWEDNTDGTWGTDYEIMYTSSSDGITWSNATVISDDGTNWNDDSSYNPSIAINSTGNIHVVWYDYTDGDWGTDIEIMYASSIDGITWSKGIVISDLHNGIIWNDGASWEPSIAIDKTDKIHVVWYDYTPGLWGADSEIMYTSKIGTEWSLPYVISDDQTYWNDGDSYNLDITVDTNGKAYVVWEDDTNGAWGIDREIMFTSFTAFTPSSGGGISFGYTFIFFMIIGVISIIGYTKKKL